MAKVLILNTGISAINVAGGLVSTGSQRWIDENDVTPGLEKYVVRKTATTETNEPSDAADSFDTETFLARSLKDMSKELEALPKDQLTELKAAELAVDDGSPRANVLEAIDTALLNIANSLSE